MENIHRRHIERKGLRGKKLLLGAAAMAVALTSGAGMIHAGTKWNPLTSGVTLTGTAASGSFYGTMGGARATADSLQYIGCEVQWTGPNANNLVTVSPTNIGYCYARDSAGNTRGCYVTIKYGTAMGLIANLNTNSYLGVQYFQTPDVTYCGWIDISNYSYMPIEAN